MSPPRSTSARHRLAVARSLPPRLVVAEAAWRGARAGTRAWGRVRHAAATTARRPSTPSGRAKGVSPFLLTDRPLPSPGTVPQAQRDACLEEARAALDGRFRVLAFGLVPFGTPVRWHADPVSHAEWPRVHHRAIAPFPGQADIKVPWEASRLHWLVALARAAHYTDDRAFLEGARELLVSWAAANPPGTGVNWANAMEAGVRAANLAWAAEIAGDRDPPLASLAAVLLRQHGWHILGNLEYSPRLTSNHYLADVVGLVHAGAALRHTAVGRAWLRFAATALQREVLKQFRPDGMNFESSTGYHRFSTELALFGLFALRQVGWTVRPDVLERFERALDALAAVTAPHGRIPAVGDEDSGLVVNLASGRDPRDPFPLLQAGGALLGDRGTAAAPGEFASWLPGPHPVGARRRGPSALRPSGVYVLEDGDLWCLVECGGVGQRGNGGHAHNDTLSFVLFAQGREIVTDPGTYTYTGDPAARDDFRRTRSHATVEVDGEEINRFVDGRLFTLVDEDRPACDAVELGSRRQTVTASHHGYSRLRDPVVHRRSWELSPGALTVRDHLECRAGHTAVVTFPLAEGTTVLGADRVGTRLRAGDVQVAVAQTDGPVLELRPEPGAVSPGYGSCRPGVTLRARIAFRGPVSWAFRFSLGGVRR
ncbi:MAG TPA: alginate lyase family protein [Acidimicrobiales bacterium]|nr:alginate lyase family protein [Acidimicrobiales bacterium]